MAEVGEASRPCWSRCTTHFVDLVEPFPPVVPDHWELGLSDLGDTSLLHEAV